MRLSPFGRKMRRRGKMRLSPFRVYSWGGRAARRSGVFLPGVRVASRTLAIRAARRFALRGVPLAFHRPTIPTAILSASPCSPKLPDGPHNNPGPGHLLRLNNGHGRSTKAKPTAPQRVWLEPDSIRHTAWRFAGARRQAGKKRSGSAIDGRCDSPRC